MARRAILWGLLTLLACADPPAADGPQITETPGGKTDGPGATGEVRRLQLTWGAVPAAPGRPNLIAYLPSGLDTSEGVNVVVFLHGWYNCAENLLRAKNGACVAGRPAREAFDLPGQLERSGKNAILLLPELAFDEARSEAFAFADENQFLWMLWETMDALGYSLWDVRRVVVVSHSGGYKAAAAIVADGGTWVNEVWLLDSLYGELDSFEGWLAVDTASLASRERRFVSLYTWLGGTLAENQAMAVRLADAGWLGDGVLLDDRTPGGVTTAVGGHGVVFKRSNLLHDPLVRVAFGELLRTSGLPARQ